MTMVVFNQIFFTRLAQTTLLSSKYKRVRPTS